MSREVSVQDQIHFIEVELTDDPGSDNYEAILATLRRSVLLERVAEAALVFHNEWAEDVGATHHTKAAVRRKAGDLFLRLQACDALAALRDHDKLGKEGKCRSCGGLGTLGCTYPDHGDSTSDHACGDETCGDCGGTGRIKLGKEG